MGAFVTDAGGVFKLSPVFLLSNVLRGDGAASCDPPPRPAVVLPLQSRSHVRTSGG